MELSRYMLGDFLKFYSQQCDIPDLTENDVSGVNKDKEFFEPSKQVGADTSKYKIVPPNHFACNLMHVGRDKILPIALNHTQKEKIVSPAYTVFSIIQGTPLLTDYFFIMLKSEERDRAFWFNTDSSVRDGMSLKDFCAIEIDLPPLAIQQKYVDVYNAMIANQQCYERGLDDLKLVCDAYIEELRRKMPSESIGKYIKLLTKNNIGSKIKYVQGVESSGTFMDTKANMQGVDIEKYTIVNKGNFAYNPSRINIGSIAMYREENPCIVSPMYIVFEVVDSNALLPEYLMLWLSRKEFQRFTWFYAAGSVRDTFDYNLMETVEIPIPSIEIQQSIVDIYKVYLQRKEINERLKEQIKSICPILIKGSLEEARKKEV